MARAGPSVLVNMARGRFYYSTILQASENILGSKNPWQFPSGGPRMLGRASGEAINI
jgi:hypothetical protein